jgi:hypothetical protein
MGNLNEVCKSDQERLIEELKNLQRECATVLRVVASTRHKEYENLAKIYLWWANASKLEGFLEGLIVNLKDYRLLGVAHGYNYSPVLMLMFGKTLSDQDRNKMSRVLNALNEEFMRRPELYAYNPVSKLVGFIKKSGGLVQLVKTSYKKAELEASIERELIEEFKVDDMELAQATENAAISSELTRMGVNYTVVKCLNKTEGVDIKEKEKIKVLSEEADTFWSSNQPHGFATFSSGVAANDDGYSYVLVKRTGTDYVVVNTVNDKKLIKEGLVKAYRKQFTALPNSLRTVCETLRTQLMPINVKLKSVEVVELNPDQSLNNDKKLARGRLLHISENNQFVLSPVSMASGVVTTVAPRHSVLEKVDYDVVMAPFSKSHTEKSLVGDLEFNLYKPTRQDCIPTTADAQMVFSHRLDVVHKANSKKQISLLFQSFSDDSVPRYSQPVYSSSYDKEIKSKFDLSTDFMVVLAREFAQPWLDEIGAHIARPSNQLIKLTFTDAQVMFGYKYLGGHFKEHKTYSYKNYLSPIPLTEQVFLTKDLMPVLACLADLPIVSDVQVKADQHVLSLSFSTTAADYLIAIPTYDIATKQRSTVGFASYQPKLRQLNEAEQEEQYINKIMAKHSLKDEGDELLIAEVDQSEGAEIYV